MNNETQTVKDLQKFAKDFEKLLSKYPGVCVGDDINGTSWLINNQDGRLNRSTYQAISNKNSL
jgi:hypothetical protein